MCLWEWGRVYRCLHTFLVVGLLVEKCGFTPWASRTWRRTVVLGSGWAVARATSSNPSVFSGLQVNLDNTHRKVPVGRGQQECNQPPMGAAGRQGPADAKAGHDSAGKLINGRHRV